MIGVVGCGAEKLEHAAPARELYTGQLFRKSLAYAEARCDRVWIVSAKGGLLALDQVVEPYNAKLGTGRAERWAWGRQVWDQLRCQHLNGPHELLVLAGVTYAEPIIAFARGAGWTVHDPLAGLAIGGRLQLLTADSKERP